MHQLSHPGQLAKGLPTLLPQQPALGSSVLQRRAGPPPPPPICGCQTEGCTPSEDCLIRREPQAPPPSGPPFPLPFLPPECRRPPDPSNPTPTSMLKACLLATAAVTTTVFAQSTIDASNPSTTAAAPSPSSSGKGKIVEISVGAVRIRGLTALFVGLFVGLTWS